MFHPDDQQMDGLNDLVDSETDPDEGGMIEELPFRARVVRRGPERDSSDDERENDRAMLELEREREQEEVLRRLQGLQGRLQGAGPGPGGG
eukprot:712169-Prorocentrum_minimum.AAC.1